MSVAHVAVSLSKLGDGEAVEVYETGGIVDDESDGHAGAGIHYGDAGGLGGPLAEWGFCVVLGKSGRCAGGGQEPFAAIHLPPHSQGRRFDAADVHVGGHVQRGAVIAPSAVGRALAG